MLGLKLIHANKGAPSEHDFLSCFTRLMAIQQKLIEAFNLDISLNITNLRLHPHIPRVNDSQCWASISQLTRFILLACRNVSEELNRNILQHVLVTLVTTAKQHSVITASTKMTGLCTCIVPGKSALGKIGQCFIQRTFKRTSIFVYWFWLALAIPPVSVTHNLKHTYRMFKILFPSFMFIVIILFYINNWHQTETHVWYKTTEIYLYMAVYIEWYILINNWHQTENHVWYESTEVCLYMAVCVEWKILCMYSKVRITWLSAMQYTCKKCIGDI